MNSMCIFFRIICFIGLVSSFGCLSTVSNEEASSPGLVANPSVQAKVNVHHDHRGKLMVQLYHTKSVKEDQLLLVEGAIREYYQAVVIRRGELQIPYWCVNTKSGKIRSDSMLVFMDRILKHEPGKQLLITDRVISTTRTLNGKTYPDWTIMGYGQLGGKNCVVSTATLKTNAAERLKKVVLHELGHTFGVNHCSSNDTCLMRDLKGVGSAIDKSSYHMCGKCKQHVVDFN